MNFAPCFPRGQPNEIRAPYNSKFSSLSPSKSHKSMYQTKLFPKTSFPHRIFLPFSIKIVQNRSKVRNIKYFPSAHIILVILFSMFCQCSIKWFLFLLPNLTHNINSTKIIYEILCIKIPKAWHIYLTVFHLYFPIYTNRKINSFTTSTWKKRRILVH